MLRGWRGDLLALLALLALVLAFCWDVLLGPRVLLPADVLYRLSPWSGLPEAGASFGWQRLSAFRLVSKLAEPALLRARLSEASPLALRTFTMAEPRH